MHIGINTLFHVPGDVGGTETYLRELLLAIARKYPDLPVTLFTHLDNDSLMKSIFSGFPSFSYNCLPFKASRRPLRIMAEQLWLPVRVRKSAVNVLWSPGYTAPFWVRCPQVVTIHDLQYKTHPEDLSWLERTTLDTLVRIACKKSTNIIAVSEFSKSEIVKFGFAPSEKIHAVLEGVDESFGVTVNGSDVRTELKQHMPVGEPYILCVAHTYPHKNVHLLIDAFNEIKQVIPHNLVIVGKARLGEPAVVSAVDRLDEKNRLFRLKGGVAFDMLKFLYQQADLFVLPSSYEGFGLPVLEAMMAGTEVVCSRNASIPEVGGACASYVQNLTASDIAHTIVEVVNNNEEKRNKQKKDARKWAETFTWERAAEATVRLLCSCK